jgi:hypothetical protein
MSEISVYRSFSIQLALLSLRGGSEERRESGGKRKEGRRENGRKEKRGGEGGKGRKGGRKGREEEERKEEGGKGGKRKGGKEGRKGREVKTTYLEIHNTISVKMKSKIFFTGFFVRKTSRS